MEPDKLSEIQATILNRLYLEIHRSTGDAFERAQIAGSITCRLPSMFPFPDHAD